ncbi:hypothetical protein FRC17_011285 [Serendipita sp. 399]|nr:hypothetical protein FRC17_011285 [Serendipita sp. 399]
MSGIQPADRDNAVSVSLRGRWAVMESDQKGRDRLKKDIENWKLLVHRQRQSEKRVVYAQTLITMVTFTGDMDLLKDVFSWLLGRFLKCSTTKLIYHAQDVDFRNTVFRNYMHYISRCLAGNKKNLQVSAQVGDELIASCIDALSKARMEPDFDINHYYGAYHLIRKVLVSRVWLCERLRVEMDATETLLAPLEKLWIQLEKISLEDHGTFGDPKQYPLRVERGGHYWNGFCHSTEEDASTFGTYFRSTVDLSLQSRRVVVRFLDRLGRSRDQLYADLRDDPERTCQELSGYESRSPWPLEVQESFLEGVPMHQDAPFFLEYLRKIIFLPLDKDNRTEKDVTSGQWQEALRFYASIARYDPGSRDDMLGSVIEHYRTMPVKSDGSKVDLAPHLLAVKEFMDVVHSSERLTHLMFSPYNATDSDYSRLNLPLDIERSSFENQIELDVNFNLLKRRQTDITRVNMVQNIVPEHTLRGSHQLRRHLTILAATLWINSLAGIEKGDKGYQLLQGDSKQLDFAALYANSGLPDISYVRYGGSWVKRRFFAANVDVLSKEELHNLIGTVKALIPAKEGQPHRYQALRILAVHIIPRSHSPTLMEEDIFEILRDPEHSSIHRYFLTSSLLGVVSPDESKRLTRRFVDQTVEAIKTGAMLDDESTSKDASEAIEESEAIELVDPEEADNSDTMDELESTEQAEPTEGTDESKSKPAIKWRNVPWTAFDQLLAYLKPDLTQQEHLIQGWKSNIRPLLEWTLQQAQTARAQAGQNGNQYDHIITRIKAYLLPFPGLYPELGGDYIKYATELYELVLESYSTPLLHQAWLFDSLIPNIQRGSGGLVPMTWTLMTLLVKEAEARLDPTERLLGYRLVQVVGDNIHPIVTREDRSEITNLLLSMEDHKDPNVRLLALNIGRERRYDVPKPEKAEPEAQQTQPASQRGRGRGRGRARGRGRGRR